MADDPTLPLAAQPTESGRRALDGIVVVLWETQDPVNVAGTIRAMKNFGLTRVRLVSPVVWDPWRFEGIAHGTADVVQRAELFDTLDEALADAALVIGTTGRERRHKRTLARPRAIAPELLARGRDSAEGRAGPVCILFGREDIGLTNEALDRCDRICIIPTNPEHASLNLAQAVLVLAYELFMGAEGTVQPFRDPRHPAPPAPNAILERLFGETERALRSIDFFKTRKAENVMRTVREVVRRAALDEREAALVRAMAIEVAKYMRRRGIDALGEAPDPAGEAAPDA